jgi:hypothetical protein
MQPKICQKVPLRISLPIQPDMSILEQSCTQMDRISRRQIYLFGKIQQILAILFHKVDRRNIYFVSCFIAGAKTRDEKIGMFIAIYVWNGGENKYIRKNQDEKTHTYCLFLLADFGRH